MRDYCGTLTNCMNKTGEGEIYTSHLEPIRTKGGVLPKLFACLALSTSIIGLTGCDGSDNPLEIVEKDLDIRLSYNGNIDISQSPKIKIENNTLRIGNIKLFEWSKNTPTEKVELYSSNYKTFTEQSKIADGSNLTQDQEGNYIGARITYTNGQIREKRSTGKLTNEVTSQIENLKHLNYKVDETIDLTQGGKLNITNASIEMDGEIITIGDPKNFTPDFPGPAWTFTGTINGEPYQFNISIAPKEYHPIQLPKINPTDSLPKINSGNENIAEEIYLGYVPAWCITNMANEYGLGNLSASEYRNEIKKYHVGIIGEIPDDNNYTLIGSNQNDNSDHDHANKVWSILTGELHNSKVNKVVLYGSEQLLFTLADENPSHTYILGKSSYAKFFEEDDYTDNYRERQKTRKENYDKRDNIIYTTTASNIEKDPQGNYRRGVRQENKRLDPEYIYTDGSFANGENDNTKSNILIGTGCYPQGDFNITNKTSGPKIPSGFSPSVTYGGIPYPYKSKSGAMFVDDFAYTSFATPNIVGAITLCAQLCPRLKGNNLLHEIGETCDTRNMILNNERVEVIVPSPRGIAEKHLMPKNMPTEIKTGQTIKLNKGEYEGVIYLMPGTEVYIEGKGWVPYNDENKILILQQNPFTLERQLNGTESRKYLGKGQQEIDVIFIEDTWEDILINKKYYINIT